MLQLPIQGLRVISFGEKTKHGGLSKNIGIRTRFGGTVVSPCDGLVVYAGEFRTYGQLLIISPGDGYHVLISGLSQIDVQVGQSVLMGEPVGVMSSATTTKAAQDKGRSRPYRRVPEGPAAHRSRSVVVGGLSKGSRMTRKSDFAFWAFMVLAGIAGATTVFNVTRTYSATPGNSQIYKQLDLFGDVLERVRTDYVEPPDDCDADRRGHQRHAVRARPAFRLPQPQELPRHAGADEGGVRRSWHRGHHGGGCRQGGIADRRYAGGQGRPDGQRPHHASRRGADRRADAGAGGREDARPGQYLDHADHRAPGEG